MASEVAIIYRSRLALNLQLLCSPLEVGIRKVKAILTILSEDFARTREGIMTLNYPLNDLPPTVL